MESLISKAVANPIQFAIAFAIIFASVSFFFIYFIKLFGNPLKYTIDFFKIIGPTALKEILFRAGPAGMVNLILTILLTIIAMIILVKPKLTFFFQPESEDSRPYSLAMFIVIAIVIIMSLRFVREVERFKLLNKKD